MNKKFSIRTRNFLILMSAIIVIIVIAVMLIFDSAVNIVNTEICSISMNRTRQAEHTLVEVIEQNERVAAGLTLIDEVNLFWGMESPEKSDGKFYINLKAYLKNLVYSMKERISSIILYSSLYDRIIDQDMNFPHSLRNMSDGTKDIDWLKTLKDVGEQRIVTSIQIRSVNNSYPYVMTVVKQIALESGWGAVAINIDLKELYELLQKNNDNNTSVWVLDENGKVIVREGKRELLASNEQFEELQFFEKNQDEIEYIDEIEGKTIVYTQEYCEKYRFYIVTVSELKDFHERIQAIKVKAIGMGVCGILIACMLIALYIKVEYKSIKNILYILDHPEYYQDYSVYSEKEVTIIAEKIVSSLQLNESLYKRLEERMEVLNQTKIQALKAQIDPHFLFNTLNMIVMMIDLEVENSEAAELITKLSKILAYSLSDENVVVLSQELEYTEKYIYILEKRYKSNISVYFEIDPELLDAKVPKMLFQPLIENAVFHGFNAKECNHGGKIVISGRKDTISAREEKIDVIFLEVIDNGKGMTREKIERITKLIKEERVMTKHIGIQNVAKRLELMYPNTSGLKIESDRGTCISMYFPLSKE